MHSLRLTDSWRWLNPVEKSHTWSRGNPPAARRLDYIFVGESLISSINQSIIKSIGFSDHRLVITTFEVSSFKRGKGFYKLNTSLLKDKAYCKMISHEIRSSTEEYNSVNPHLRWEVIKTNVREVSQQYSKYKVKMKKDKLESLRLH